MRRRDFLKASTAFALAGWTFSITDEAVATAAKIIDAHCHFFNADDLPIVEFVEKVVLPRRSEYQQYATKYGHVLRFLIGYLAEWMKKNAPTAGDEVVLLDKIKNGTAQPRTQERIEIDDIRQLAELINDLKALRISEKSFYFREQLVSFYLPGVIIGNMHREAYPGEFTATGIISNADGALDYQKWRDPAVLARDLYRNGKGPISLYLRWASVLTHYRFELADELYRIDGDRIKLATPALIDFSNWLDDKDDVKLAKQVEAMGRIARRDGTMRVHGYAPFDPLREALYRKRNESGESPLDLIKRALTSEGFIGVKLYPPMGFLPYDNAKTLNSDKDFPKHLEPIFGKKLGVALDAVFDDFYCWCVAEQVPVLAHAADSNGADENYSKRAHPDNWAAVTGKFPGIRVSLAHFGDFDAGFDRPGNRNPRLSNTWEWRMAMLAKNSPQSLVYIDLSYLVAALLDNDNNGRREVVRMLKSVNQEFDGLAQQLMFGTDWVMFGKEKNFSAYGGNGQYADRVAALLSAANFSDPSIERIMYTNAGNFLGLTLPTTVAGNRQRLTTFYNNNGLDGSWLNDFTVQASNLPSAQTRCRL